ncbi:hypothetical protein DPSP01_013151 [Paraphaeosphaeria sporulosa]
MLRQALATAVTFLSLSHMASGAIVFLSNCHQDYYSGQYQWSEMDYFTNTPPTASYPDGKKPESKTPSIEAKGPNTGGRDDRVHWEGRKTCGKFSDTTFCATIAADAGGKSKGTYVGSGSNGFGTKFDCYSEGGERYVYAINPPDATGLTSSCYAIYYCSTK